MMTNLTTTQLRLFVVFLDTGVIPAGQVDQNGIPKITTVGEKLSMSNAVVEIGALVLTQKMTVAATKTSFLLVLLVSSETRLIVTGWCNMLSDTFRRWIMHLASCQQLWLGNYRDRRLGLLILHRSFSLNKRQVQLTSFFLQIRLSAAYKYRLQRAATVRAALQAP